jgi:hypothetical protein
MKSGQRLSAARPRGFENESVDHCHGHLFQTFISLLGTNVARLEVDTGDHMGAAVLFNGTSAERAGSFSSAAQIVPALSAIEQRCPQLIRRGTNIEVISRMEGDPLQ